MEFFHLNLILEFFLQKHSARRGIYRMYYYRNLLRFLCRIARQANRHEMLFERSEFIE